MVVSVDGDGVVSSAGAQGRSAEVLLSGGQVCALLRIQPATWRNYVRRGYAPEPVDPGNVDHPPAQRRPRWSLAQVVGYVEGKKRRWHRRPAS